MVSNCLGGVPGCPQLLDLLLIYQPLNLATLSLVHVVPDEDDICTVIVGAGSTLSISCYVV